MGKVLQCGCSVLQCAAVWCSVLQRVANPNGAFSRAWQFSRPSKKKNRIQKNLDEKKGQTIHITVVIFAVRVLSLYSSCTLAVLPV